MYGKASLKVKVGIGLDLAIRVSTSEGRKRGRTDNNLARDPVCAILPPSLD
jgi:hypothetical protein